MMHLQRLSWLLLLFVCVTSAACAGDTALPGDDGVTAPVRPSDAVAPPDSVTEARFEAVMAFAQREDLHERPIGDVMQTLGERFLDAPYIVGPLDETEEERLVCRLDGFDCFTFVESMLAMARGILQQDHSWDGFARRTREQRYRHGEIEGYCSRIHYFSEWIARNEERGLVNDITRELGGQHLAKTLDYMTEHRDAYDRLAVDSTFRCIEEMERNLRDQEIYYIPQDEISSAYGDLKAGDIIAMATDIEGLDVTHTGLVYGGDVSEDKGLLHASTSGGVKVSPDLQSYVQNIEVQIGIVVARPAAPSDSLAQ